MTQNYTKNMNWSEIKQKIRYGDQRQVADLLKISVRTVYSVIAREKGVNEPMIKNSLIAIICNREAVEKKFKNLLNTTKHENN